MRNLIPEEGKATTGTFTATVGSVQVFNATSVGIIKDRFIDIYGAGVDPACTTCTIKTITLNLEADVANGPHKWKDGKLNSMTIVATDPNSKYDTTGGDLYVTFDHVQKRYRGTLNIKAQLRGTEETLSVTGEFDLSGLTRRVTAPG